MAQRKRYPAEFKTKVVLEVLKNENPLAQMASRYEVHSGVITQWKKEFLSRASEIFQGKNKRGQEDPEAEKERLYREIGKMKVENDWLKKKLGAWD